MKEALLLLAFMFSCAMLVWGFMLYILWSDARDLKIRKRIEKELEEE